MIIGVTGSFGSGKTTAANMFKRYGFKVINADKLYRKISGRNTALKDEIMGEFGTLDRNEIKKIVLNDSSRLKRLNRMTHPIIIKEIKREINKTKNKRIIVDIPLLFEAKLEKIFDKIIVVKCSSKAQINRILKKKKYTKIEIHQIISSQMPPNDKIKKADFIVDNSNTINETRSQIDGIISLL